MNISQTKLPENIIKNKKVVLIAIIILIMLVVLFYVFILSGNNDDKSLVSSIKSLPNIEQEKKVLKSYKFIRLDSFLKEPIKVEAADTGRQNPFIKVE